MMDFRSVIVRLAASGLLAACSNPYYSSVRMQMPGGYAVTTVQKADSQEACRASSRTYIKSMEASCPDCKVQSFSCGMSLGGEEQALWSDQAIAQYSVSSRTTRVLLAGPEPLTKPVCDQLARDISAKGMPATCIPPGQARK